MEQLNNEVVQMVGDQHLWKWEVEKDREDWSGFWCFEAGRTVAGVKKVRGAGGQVGEGEVGEGADGQTDD